MADYKEGAKYLCKVVSQGFDESTKKKTPFFFLQVEPIGEIDPANPDGTLISCPDKARTITMYLSEKAAPYTIEALRKLGYTGASFRGLDTGGHSFIDQEIEADCTHEHSDDGKVFDKFELSRNSTIKESKDGVAQRLDSLFGRELQKSSGRAVERPTAAPSTNPDGSPGHSDADMPF